MASRTTPKGRVHLEGVTPHGEPDDSQGLCTSPIVVGTDRLGKGEPPHGESGNSQGSRYTSRFCCQLGSIHRPLACTTNALTTEVNRLEKQGSSSPVTLQGGVLWPCPHTLPSPALAAACGAVG
jgi:hypothetical protein